MKKVQSRERRVGGGGRHVHPGSKEQHATQYRLMEYSSAGFLRRGERQNPEEVQK